MIENKNLKAAFDMLTQIYERSLIDINKKYSREELMLPGMTDNDEKYLEILVALKDPTFTEFAEASNISKPAATQIIKKLVSKGYVTKEHSSHDKRIYNLRVTDSVNEYVENLDIIIYTMVSEWFNVLSDDEITTLKSLLEKVVTNIE